MNEKIKLNALKLNIMVAFLRTLFGSCLMSENYNHIRFAAHFLCVCAGARLESSWQICASLFRTNSK